MCIDTITVVTVNSKFTYKFIVKAIFTYATANITAKLPSRLTDQDCYLPSLSYENSQKSYVGCYGFSIYNWVFELAYLVLNLTFSSTSAVCIPNDSIGIHVCVMSVCMHVLLFCGKLSGDHRYEV